MGTEGQFAWICTSCNLYVLHIALSHSSSSYWVLMYKQFDVQLFEEKKLITFCMKEDIIDWQLMENIRMHSQPKLSHQSNYSALITQKIECIQWLALTELCTILHWIWRWKLSEAWTWIFIQILFATCFIHFKVQFCLSIFESGHVLCWNQTICCM